MAEQDTFNAFVERWVPSSDRVTEARLREVEAHLEVALPGAYRRFVTQHGTPFCPGILHAVAAGPGGFHDLQEFVAIAELASATAMYESGGMPSGFVAFAMDCMGNMFLFDKADCVPGVHDAPVWFFDHDFVSIEQEAPSFAEWLERYAALASE